MEMLLEASKTKYKKKYKCPYCDNRLERQALIRHVENKHNELIPEGYTATRVVFNLINNKDHGNCVICGKQTEWNENICRYERFCSKACERAYVKQMKDRMKRIYGVDNLIYSTDQQKKMLANRRISGTYKFSDGVEHTYTGSYEKRCLEFLDKVMEYKGSDVVTPGPVIPYQYNGTTHQWITDIYIPCYNLAIDCKDGGQNKNNREMKEYREKQIEKEKAIAKQGKYNYLRLTDNNFGQLMSVLAELKLSLMENNTDKIVRINENMFPGIQGFMPMGQWNPDDVYIVPYLKNNIFAGIAVGDDAHYTNLWYQNDKGEVKRASKGFLEDSQYSVYKYKCDKREVINKLIESEGSVIDDIKTLIFGENMITDDEWKFYDSIEEICDNYTYNAYVQTITTATVLGRRGITQITEDYNANTILRLKSDSKGYYLENSITGLRTGSRSKAEFNEIEESIVKGGIL
jgi:endogenous inhibitor of DNA gyrase (YacG/DUF329 family)